MLALECLYRFIYYFLFYLRLARRTETAGARDPAQHLHPKLQHGVGHVPGAAAVALLAADRAAAQQGRPGLDVLLLADGRRGQPRPRRRRREALPAQGHAGRQPARRGTERCRSGVGIHLG